MVRSSDIENTYDEGEGVTLSYGGAPNIKYFDGKFLNAGNRTARSNDEGALSNRFLYWILKHDEALIDRYYRGSGLRHVDLRKMLDHEIPLPPLEIQRQIVAILDAHSELAELQAERVKLLKLEKDVLLERIFSPAGGFKFSIGGKEFDTSGWDSHPLGDSFTWENPGTALVLSSNYDPAYQTPVLTANKSFILGYTDESEGIYSASAKNPVVIFDDFTTDCKWVTFPFKVKSGAMKFLRATDESRFDFFFSYLALKMNPFTPSTHQRHRVTVFAQIMRFPSLEDQQVISSYFRELDNRIELEEERLQLLKTQSAVVLESIFDR